VKRRVLWFGAALVLAVGLVLTLGWQRDAFDASDLRFRRPLIPSADNAFEYLEQASDVLDWSQPRRKEFQGWLDPAKYNGDKVGDLLARNSPTLRLLTNTFARPRLQIPPVAAYGQDAPYRAEWHAFAILLALQAEEFSRAGSHEKAFETALGLVRLGHAMEDSSGGAINWLTGSAAKIMGLRQLQAVVRRAVLPSAQFMTYLADLEPYGPNGSGFTNALKLDYELWLLNLRSMPATIATSTNALSATLGSVFASATVFNLNRTMRMFADGNRAVLSAFERSYRQRPSFKKHRRDSYHRAVGMVLRRNAIGEFLFETMTPQWESFLRGKCLENATFAATKAVIALRCLQVEQGRLPQTIAELVPKYLSALPLDDFDGQPLRYDADRAILYSVGPDLEDSGGQERTVGSVPMDITFRLEF
jgi:hypothetical protein